MADALFDRRRLRALTIVDNSTWGCLAIEVGEHSRARTWPRRKRTKARARTPQRIKVDIGSEFICRAMDRWAYEHRVELDFSRRGGPIDNAKMEALRGCCEKSV